MDEWTVRKFDRFVVLTHEDKGYWGNLPNICVIPNARTFSVEEPAQGDAKKVVAVGRLNHQKGFERLIAAWAIIHHKVPEWKLDIVGEGECKEELERQIAKICRKAAKEILVKRQSADFDKEKELTVKVNGRNIKEFLGKEKYQKDKASKKAEVGIVRGLAWTSVGGDTLEIEVNVMPGKGEIQLTGKLGDVMKESAMTALSYVRSVGKEFKVSPEFFKENDFHIHVPEGAVPKDGPSAGITMATAILSAVTGKKIDPLVAMTGEITLRGRVLPIGGLKEKILAAKNAGIKKVLVPMENQKDVEEVSDEIKEGIEIHFVETMEQVIKQAFIA
jgi:ATP-dependent Lon protease